jgi:hypothetical protein
VPSAFGHFLAGMTRPQTTTSDRPAALQRPPEGRKRGEATLPSHWVVTV